MTLKSLEEVRSLLVEYLADEQIAGRAPTVARFAAEKLGIKRQSLYVMYPEIPEELRSAKRRLDIPVQGRPPGIGSEKLRSDLATARREGNALRAEMRVYAEQIRQLTLRNAELTAALELERGTSDLATRRNARLKSNDAKPKP